MSELETPHRSDGNPTELGSQGAACLLEAEQTCLRLRGGEQCDAVTHAEAYEGVMKEPGMRAELWARLGRRP